MSKHAGARPSLTYLLHIYRELRASMLARNLCNARTIYLTKKQSVYKHAGALPSLTYLLHIHKELRASMLARNFCNALTLRASILAQLLAGMLAHDLAFMSIRDPQTTMQQGNSRTNPCTFPIENREQDRCVERNPPATMVNTGT